jgi:hypothetical protein
VYCLAVAPAIEVQVFGKVEAAADTATVQRNQLCETSGCGNPRNAGTVAETTSPTSAASAIDASPWKLGNSFTTDVVGE